MPTPVSMTGTVAFSTTERIRPCAAAGNQAVDIAVQAHHGRGGLAGGVLDEADAVLVHPRRPERRAHGRRRRPYWSGWPPCRRAERRRCRSFRHSAAASEVTLGRASKDDADHAQGHGDLSPFPGRLPSVANRKARGPPDRASFGHLAHAVGHGANARFGVRARRSSMAADMPPRAGRLDVRSSWRRGSPAAHALPARRQWPAARRFFSRRGGVGQRPGGALGRRADGRAVPSCFSPPCARRTRCRSLSPSSRR